MVMHTPVSKKHFPNNLLKRLFWLLVCIFIGILIGFVGSTVSGSDIWYTAVPAVVAIGWLFFADPSQCVPPVQHGNNKADDDEA